MILRVVVIAVVLLSGCGDDAEPSVEQPLPSLEQPLPSLEQPFQAEIFLHCGVDWPRIAVDGQFYHLEARNEAETINPPRGWSDVETVTIIEGDGQLLAIGPDGSERELVPVSSEEAQPDICV